MLEHNLQLSTIFDIFLVLITFNFLLTYSMMQVQMEIIKGSWFFPYFSQKKKADISCKSSPEEMTHEFQAHLTEKIIIIIK